MHPSILADPEVFEMQSLPQKPSGLPVSVFPCSGDRILSHKKRPQNCGRFGATTENVSAISPPDG